MFHLWPLTRGDTVAGPGAKSLAERCLLVELLVLDVDGVLTDGGIAYDDRGAELKRFHVRDGSALKLWRDAGKRAALVTGRSSPVVARRAAELGIGLVRQGCADKFAAYRELLAECGLRPEQVCAVGDDLPDVPVLRNAGLAVAVADACAEARAEAQYITRAGGGGGAVREVVELVLACQGHWQDVVNKYRSCTLPI